MSVKPYRVYYDLAYDMGEGKWQKDYRTKWGAHVSRLWHVYVASWGGSAVLSSWEDRILRRAVEEDAAFQADPDAYLRGLSGMEVGHE